MTKDQKKKEIRELKSRGLSYREIARKVNLKSASTVQYHLNHPKKLHLDEENIYYEIVDEDEEFDGKLHIVSCIDGSEITLDIDKLIKDLKTIGYDFNNLSKPNQ